MGTVQCVYRSLKESGSRQTSYNSASRFDLLFAEFALPRLLESGFEVVGAVADGNALVHAFWQLHPDV